MEEQRYYAKAFTPKKLTLTGTLEVEGQNIQFISGETKLSASLARLQARVGGHNHEQVFFEHPDHPGWSIYTSDLKIATDPVLNEQPHLREVLKRMVGVRKRPHPGVYVLIGVTLLIITAIFSLFFAKNALVRFAAEQIPLEWEQKLGDQLFKSIAAEGKLITNSPHQRQLEVITERLVPAVGDARHRFIFHIMQDTNVNAFAMPGGYVVVLSGLLEQAENPEEVAGVLAHELAHVTQRHSLRKLVEQAGLIILIQTVFGDVGGLMAVVTEGSRFLLEQKFSRDFEREADDVGWAYLVQAQIDPRGLTSFFRKLERLQEQMGQRANAALALLNTHPATQERIRRLEEKWEKADPKPTVKPLEKVAGSARTAVE